MSLETIPIAFVYLLAIPLVVVGLSVVPDAVFSLLRFIAEAFFNHAD